MLNIDVAYCSDKAGRANNEDRVAVLLDGQVYLVADGMGGHQGGGIASRLVLETIQQAINANGRPPHESLEQIHGYLNQLFLQAKTICERW